jgi:hypothetical protein
VFVLGYLSSGEFIGHTFTFLTYTTELGRCAFSRL